MLLKTFITETFAAPVWRLTLDETTDTLFAEVRDVQEKQVTFSGIGLQTGTTNFKNLSLPERWLVGIETAYSGVLLLHGFQSEVLPVHKGLSGIESSTGRILWTDYNIAFDSVTKSGFVVYDARIQPKILFTIDFINGQRKTAETINLPIDTAASIKNGELIPANLVPPHLLKLPPYQNVVHYLIHNNFRIVSLHALSSGSLNQHLFVFDEDEQLVFEDILNENIQKLQPEAFMSYKNKLIWLKDRLTIKVLNL